MPPRHLIHYITDWLEEYLIILLELWYFGIEIGVCAMWQLLIHFFLVSNGEARYNICDFEYTNIGSQINGTKCNHTRYPDDLDLISICQMQTYKLQDLATAPPLGRTEMRSKTTTEAPLDVYWLASRYLYYYQYHYQCICVFIRLQRSTIRSKPYIL